MPSFPKKTINNRISAKLLMCGMKTTVKKNAKFMSKRNQNICLFYSFYCICQHGYLMHPYSTIKTIVELYILRDKQKITM